MFQKCKLKSITEELERFISENMPVSAKQISVSCQTPPKNNQHEQDLKVELENKNREVEGLLVKAKEAEVDIQRKDMIIEGISEKVIIQNANVDHYYH